MEKYLILFVILIVLYYLHTCWVDSLVDAKIRKENFADSSSSGMDDSTAIQALGSIAKDLMSGGGLKVQGDSSFAGVANFAKDIKVTDRNILAELNAINTRLKELAGRNIVGELDVLNANVADLKAKTMRIDRSYYMKTGTRLDGSNAWHNGEWVHTFQDGHLGTPGGCCQTGYTFSQQ